MRLRPAENPSSGYVDKCHNCPLEGGSWGGHSWGNSSPAVLASPANELSMPLQPENAPRQTASGSLVVQGAVPGQKRGDGLVTAGASYGWLPSFPRPCLLPIWCLLQTGMDALFIITDLIIANSTQWRAWYSCVLGRLVLMCR